MNLRNNLSGKTAYRSFIPTPIEEYQYSVDDAKLLKVSAVFKELNELLPSLSEEDRLQLIRMEANDSWRLADDRQRNPFSFAPGINAENVDNLVRATVYGEEALEELPISTRLIRNIHYLVCEGSDYDRKYRGEYRKSPVWIGKSGAGLSDADFVPPVGEDMTAAIANLDNYINYSEENVYVKAAVIHYQFEMIHPFVDGNGRTGRLLNNLFLTGNGVLSSTILLLSHIILRDYNQYCEEIGRVNETDNLTAWISYWLDMLLESTRYTIQVINGRD